MAAKSPQDWLDQWGEYFAANDADGILSLYDPDAVFVAEPGKPMQGHAALKEVLEGLLALNGTLKLNTRGVVMGASVPRLPLLATLYSPWTLDAAGPDGPINVGGDATIVLAKQSDGWLAMIDDFCSQA